MDNTGAEIPEEHISLGEVPLSPTVSDTVAFVHTAG